MKLTEKNKPICLRLHISDIARISATAAHQGIKSADLLRYIITSYLNYYDEGILNQ